MIAKAKRIISLYELCDSCLGRFFWKETNGQSNRDRGMQLRSNMLNPYKGVCYVCRGVFSNIENLAKGVFEFDLNYDSFLIGSRWDEIPARIKSICQEFDLKCESVKSEFNREVRIIVSNITAKNVDFKNPDVVFVFSPEKDEIDVKINPIFIYGRYWKFKEMPQTKWHCRSCKGRGCRKCDFTGKLYDESVEEVISKILLKYTGGESYFHGCGREDIDVKMLGTGRPFILEIKQPKKRKVDPKSIEREINFVNKDKIKVSLLGFVSRNVVRNIKAAATNKTYRAIVELERPITDLKPLEKMITDINQKTPKRVLHRRSDKTRKRKVLNIDAKKINETGLELTLKTQSGLYIKELISGDSGRTNPSVAGVLKNPARCVNLEVIEVEFEDDSVLKEDYEWRDQEDLGVKQERS